MTKTRKRSGAGNETHFDRYVTGGYFIVREFARDRRMDSTNFQGRIVSVSRCLADILPDLWAIDWVIYEDRERRKKAARFDLTPHAMIKVIEYLTQSLQENETGWPGVFYSLEMAHQFVNAYLDPGCDFKLLGIGLHERLVESFLKNKNLLQENTKYGIYEAVSRREQLDSSGIPLGFEILGYDQGDFHSWLCDGLHLEIEKEFAYGLNQSGLIDNFKEALNASIFIEQEGLNAEPGIWMPWLLVEY